MKMITKWCIRRNETNHEEINKWFSERTNKIFKAKSDFKSGYAFRDECWYYLHYPSPQPTRKHVYKKIVKGYTEITFYEFKRFILNKNFIKTKWKQTQETFILRDQKNIK